jgi:hypothetical protein
MVRQLYASPEGPFDLDHRVHVLETLVHRLVEAVLLLASSPARYLT